MWKKKNVILYIITCFELNDPCDERTDARARVYRGGDYQSFCIILYTKMCIRCTRIYYFNIICIGLRYCRRI